MFNAMMDPEFMKLAQEQMSKIPPAELAKLQQQMLSNPELMKLATESMQNLRPEDVKLAAEQLKHTKHEDIAELTEKMANASPEELATLRANVEAQFSYQISAAEMLKKQGNELHSNKQYREATDKYLRAKNNLKSIPLAKSSTLRLQCSLNLMSCYLKTMRYEECIKEGSEVLKQDLKNVKGLYRRGQAFREIGNLDDAVADLNKAHEFSPEDETIADVLRDTKEMLLKDRGVTIEEIEEEETISVPSSLHNTIERLDTQPIEASKSKQNTGSCSTILTDNLEPCLHESYSGASPVGPEALRTFTKDPSTIRLFQKYVSNADSETISAMGLSGMPPDVIKTATEMIGSMKAEELQKMLEVASSLKANELTSNMNGYSMTPELIKTASDKISRMSSEELSKIYEHSSSFNANNVMAASVPSVHRSESSSQASVPVISTSAGTSDTRMPPSSSSDLQETMRNSMKDPAMLQMFTSIMKNMNPEMMASMGEQFGMKLSKEDVARAHQVMASLSPSDLDRMMLWAERAQKGMETVKKTKNWLFGRPGLILAICMLILAIILHQLGYIGS